MEILKAAAQYGPPGLAIGMVVTVFIMELRRIFEKLSYIQGFITARLNGTSRICPFPGSGECPFQPKKEEEPR
jgi:hypothetical protein